jgi:peptidoglycan-associated lipoprotein
VGTAGGGPKLSSPLRRPIAAFRRTSDHGRTQVASAVRARYGAAIRILQRRVRRHPFEESCMKNTLIGLCVALLLAGCGGSTSTKPSAPVEQRDVTTQAQSDAAVQAAADAARVKQQQEEAARKAAAAEEERRRAEEAARMAAADQPVVQPLPDTRVTEKQLTDPASMVKDPASPLSKRSVYYDFDMYNIREEFQPLVEAHAKFLREHKDIKIRVEGNCDERGSREYNLALGQRRADSIKRAMTLLGVPPKQIETVSFGAEKPKALGSNEEAWAENRRSDIVYVGIDTQQ